MIFCTIFYILLIRNLVSNIGDDIIYENGQKTCSINE